MKQQPKRTNLPMLRKPLGGHQVEKKEKEEVEVEEEEQVEEEENEEAAGRSHTGTAVCRRAIFPGMTKSFGCTS